MIAQMMNDGMMNGQMMDGTMTFCMVASTLFALAILIAVIVQTVLQVKILREMRKLRETQIATKS